MDFIAENIEYIFINVYGFLFRQVFTISSLMSMNIFSEMKDYFFINVYEFLCRNKRLFFNNIYGFLIRNARTFIFRNDRLFLY